MAKRNRRKNRPLKRYYTFDLLIVLLLYSFILTVAYIQLRTLTGMPTVSSTPIASTTTIPANQTAVLNPLIKFVIGSPTNYSISNMTQVPLNQTFCPETPEIQKNAAAVNRYLYYAYVNPGQDFNYSIIYNNSARTFVYATVLPPFKLVSFQDLTHQIPYCDGYPNDLGSATVIIQAPNSSYFGPIYGVLYFSNK